MQGNNHYKITIVSDINQVTRNVDVTLIHKFWT